MIAIGRRRAGISQRLLAQRLGVPAEKAVLMQEEQGDLFTSSLACVLAEARRQGKPAKGDLALVIEVGSGVQVACALYRGAS